VFAIGGYRIIIVIIAIATSKQGYNRHYKKKCFFHHFIPFSTYKGTTIMDNYAIFMQNTCKKVFKPLHKSSVRACLQRIVNMSTFGLFRVHKQPPFVHGMLNNSIFSIFEVQNLLINRKITIFAA
jgi:hypothetical protein